MSTAHRDKWRAARLPDTELWTLHFDGSCPKNPGPMGIGYTLGRAGYPPIVEVGEQIGAGTNNVAEYQALLAGMRHALRLGMFRLRILSDSLLIVKQYGGHWKSRDYTLGRLLREAELLSQCFHGRPKMTHLPREDNDAADALSRSLENVSPRLPEPRPGRSLLGWQAASLNVWWHVCGVRSAAILARIHRIQDVQVDQIVTGRAYADVTFDGLPHYAEIRAGEPEFLEGILRASEFRQEPVR